MKNNLIHLSICITLVMLSSCTQNENKRLIIGTWSGVSWTANDQPTSYDPALTSFTFDDQGNYMFQYADNIEQGKYFISNNQLYTTPDGGQKIMVKIVSLTEESLTFDMNRGGTAEQLTLARK
jgi:hypothetical protein